MEQKKKNKKAGFIVGFVIVTILYLAFIEIYKITLAGWIVGVILLAAFCVVRLTLLKDKKWYFKLLAWICALALLAGNAALFWPPEKQVSAVDVKDAKTTDVVNVEQGQLTGVYNEDESVAVYAGIPYAEPPVDELRWKEPVPAKAWDGVRACDTFAPMSMQSRNNPVWALGSQIVGYNNYKFTMSDNYNEAMSEDSLYLNVWAPADVNPGDDLPVVVYYHGGSLQTGQAYFQDYNGEEFAKNGVIFVTVSYRLGIFGYLASDELAAESPNGTTGNYGLLDQIEALKWVCKNISNFGGDMNNITIAGESAGSSSVNAICTSPLAKGLFKNAIGESSGILAKKPYHTFLSREEAIQVGKDAMSQLGVSSVGEMRKLPADQLLSVAGEMNSMTVDGYALEEQPYLTYEKGENNESALLNGYNANEAYVFMMFQNNSTAETYKEDLKRLVGDYNEELAALYPATTDDEAKANIYELYSIAWFAYSHHVWSDYVSAQGKDTYLYYFTKENGALGTWHAGEMPYVYGNLDMSTNNFDQSDVDLSKKMVAYFTNFAKTGNPNAAGLPTWEKYNDNHNKIMELGTNIGMIDNKYTKAFEIFDKYMDTFAQ